MSDQNHKHMSLGDWLITFLILLIPIVGIVMLFVWAFSSTTNRSKSNWAKASLIFSAVPLLIVIFLSFLSSLAFVSYTNYVDKGYNTEAQIALKDIAAASEIYEAMHGGQQTNLEELEYFGFLDINDSIERKWMFEIYGDIFTATSSDEMDDGAGHEVRYNRSTGEFSGYGFEY